MATVTLRPNAIFAGDNAGWTNVGGAASINAALADNSDATYMQAGAGAYGIGIEFATSALPTTSQIRSVTQRVRTSSPSSTGYLRSRVAVLNASGSGLHYAQTWEVTPTTTITTFTAPSLGSDTDGAWTQAKIDSLRLDVYDTPTGTAGGLRVYEAYLDVVYNAAPVVVVTAPTEGSTVTNNARPTVSWTYTDPEGDLQERCHVKVFNASQYNAGGFDPTTSTAFWDSTITLAEANSTVVGVDLPNDSYRAYVRCADVGSGGRWSAWDYNAFVINSEPVHAPVLTATGDNSTGVVTIDVRGRDNMLTLNQSSVETDLTGFVAVANTTLARSTLVAAHGTFSLSMTSVAAGDMEASTLRTTSGRVISASTFYTARASFRAGATTRTVRLWLDYFSSAGTLVASFGSTNITPNNTAFAEATVTGPSPSTGVYAAVRFVVVGTTAASEVFYVDKVGLAPGALNMVTTNQASVETNTGGFEPNPNATIVRDTTRAFDGSASLRLDVTSLSGANPNVHTLTGTSGILITTGRNYSVRVAVRHERGTAKDIRLAIDWYAGNSFLSTSFGSTVSVPSATWTALTMNATAPASATHATILVQPVSPTAAVGDVWWIDALGFFDVDTATTVPPWSLPVGAGGAAWTAGGSATTARYIVERSTDGGATWKTVASSLVPSTTALAVSVNDYNIPSGSTARYRARSFTTTNTSTNSNLPVVSMVPTRALLVDPTGALASVALNIHSESFNTARTETQAIFTTLGRTRPVVLAGTVMGEAGTLELSFLDKPSYDAFEALRNAQRTLWFTTPYAGMSFYVRLGEVRGSTLLLGGQSRTVQKRIVQIDFVEVDAP